MSRIKFLKVMGLDGNIWYIENDTWFRPLVQNDCWYFTTLDPTVIMPDSVELVYPITFEK